MILFLAFLGLATIVFVGYWLIREVCDLQAHGVYHCHQIDELRYLLALLARHVDEGAVGGLPVEVESYLREMAHDED